VNLKLAFNRLWCVCSAFPLVTATVLTARLVMIATTTG
jgi:hypothetical protein